jgi:hypothetical protein
LKFVPLTYAYSHNYDTASTATWTRRIRHHNTIGVPATPRLSLQYVVTVSVRFEH